MPCITRLRFPRAWKGFFRNCITVEAFNMLGPHEQWMATWGKGGRANSGAAILKPHGPRSGRGVAKVWMGIQRLLWVWGRFLTCGPRGAALMSQLWTQRHTVVTEQQRPSPASQGIGGRGLAMRIPLRSGQGRWVSIVQIHVH